MSFTTEALNHALTLDIGRTKPPTDISSSRHYAAYLLQQNLTKKFADSTTTQLAEDNAARKFELVNKSLLAWVEPSEDSESWAAFHRGILTTERQFIDQHGFCHTNIGKAFNVGMVGAGASIDATDHNFVDKLFNSPLTATHPILHTYYMEACSNFKPWRKAEINRQRQYGKVRVVKGNNMFFVPKETIIARTAATEPTLNMFGQLGYGYLIGEILKQHHSIDLSTQPNINQWMARSGSLNGEYATIDLSSASDMIGHTFCKRFLPLPVIRDLELLRSPITRIKGRNVKLNMISTMGNGFTFPLQTLIFANLVLSVMIEAKEPVFDVYGKRRYSVFGDDIICPTRVYDKVFNILTACGFIVNAKKSFSFGKFRESCGGDFFNGVNVRAVYFKKCTDESHVYSLINRLMDWTERHGIPLPSTSAYLRSLVSFRPIPLYEDETAGIRTPLSRLTSRKVSIRGNFYYHPRKQVVVKVRPELRTIEKFYHAFHVALLHGSFRKGRITPRVIPGEEAYKVIKSEAPSYWDFVSDARFTTEGRSNAFEVNFPIRSVS